MSGASFIPSPGVDDDAFTACTSSTRPVLPFEGQMIYETDTDRVQIYNGSSWVEYGRLGSWTTFTPTVTQSATVTTSASNCRYMVSGKLCVASYDLTLSSAGTASNTLKVELPFPAAGLVQPLGQGLYFDASASKRYNVGCESDSVSSSFMYLLDYINNASFGSTVVTAASGDVFRGSITYEIA